MFLFCCIIKFYFPKRMNRLSAVSGSLPNLMKRLSALLSVGSLPNRMNRFSGSLPNRMNRLSAVSSTESLPKRMNLLSALSSKSLPKRMNLLSAVVSSPSKSLPNRIKRLPNRMNRLSARGARPNRMNLLSSAMTSSESDSSLSPPEKLLKHFTYFLKNLYVQKEGYIFAI